MTASSPSFAARERRELADLLTELGPAAPTLCAGWDTAHLAAHLVVRERRPDALVGLGAEAAGGGGPLASWTHRLEDQLRESTPYAEVVDRLRGGPPAWSPMRGRSCPTASTPPSSRSTTRTCAGPSRAGSRAGCRGGVQDALWTAAGLFARRAAAGRRGGLVLRRSDVAGEEKRFGAAGTTVEGEPMELLLWAAGRRDVARVTVS